ncbi:MAG: hypothetical protein EOM72_10925 [Opitutae bacterium]|nr:hypothetical protein [Opitutae bacterium]
MSRLEKSAYVNLAVFGIACLLFAMLRPHLGSLRAMGAFGLIGLWGMEPLFYRRSKESPALDERELSILRRSWRIGHGAFWLVYVVVLMCLWNLHRGGQIAISADILPWLVLSAFMLVGIVKFVATLILSRMDLRHAE